MNELYLYGSVGADFWGEECFSASDVINMLAAADGDITVRINSGGGIATDGQAIYNLLKDHDGRVDVVIDGAAASAASLIAMAGDTITMRAGSYMMIHDPAQPFTEGRGTEGDHLQLAQALGVTANGYASVYGARVGMSVEGAREIMKAETWYDPEAAVAAGFADVSDIDTPSEAAAAFDYRIYNKAPKPVLATCGKMPRQTSKTAVMAMMAGVPAPQPKGQKMENEDQVMTSEMSEDEDEDATMSQGDGEEDQEMVEGDGDEDEDADATATSDTVAILDLAEAMGRPMAEARTLIADGATLQVAATTFTAKMKGKNPMTMNKRRGKAAAQPQRKGATAQEKFRKGAAMALMAKVGLEGGERNEFASMSLAELARESLMISGETQRFSDRRKMVGRAFTMAGAHSTSDFAEILSNVMGKAALQGWDEAEETYPMFTRKGVLTDFKETKRVGAGLFAALPQVIEGADYTYGTVGDRGEPIALATYGRLLRITRQAIINDDLSILGALPRKMGRAAKRTIGDLVFAILTGNPLMSDGVALFDAAHNNLAAAGGALGVDTFDAGRVAMRTQKEEGATLNISPSKLIVPAALETTANILMTSQVDPRVSKGHAPNPVSGAAEVISDGRLDDDSSTSWYLAADPNAFDTIEVAYLDGNEVPFLDEQTAWSSDGVELKVRMDAGVTPLDHRTFYKNAGS